ncbi:hypothetical protein [Pseudomonas carassii]|uniref:Uncharacterized protein n=1 Tax=Pseudomonas carassii TaxID=3115855 RepID=A0ABU7H7I1_9PSED|nr:hypothetical protein [Pseudomonas sp. 137P]MEE1886967.1 hypothetical protein [Pseudomonas sp. 137P]
MSLYFIRYLSFAASGLPILIGLGLENAVARSRYWTLLLLACLAGQIAALHHLYEGQVNTNNSDWRHVRLDSVLGKVNELWLPGDLIVVNGLFGYYTANYYNATGHEPLVYERGQHGDNSGQSPATYGWLSLIFPKSEQLYVTDLNKLFAPSGRVWWIGVGMVENTEQ